MVRNGLAARPHFGVFLTDGEDVEPSEVAFGAADTRRMLEPLSWSSVYRPDLGYWVVPILAVRVDGVELDFCKDGTCRGVVDTGTSHLGVPGPHDKELQELLKVDAGDLLDCRLAKSPKLEIELEGKTIDLFASSYMRRLPLREDVSVSSDKGVTLDDEKTKKRQGRKKQAFHRPGYSLVQVGPNSAEGELCVRSSEPLRCPAEAANRREDIYGDKFVVYSKGDEICVNRTDQPGGWGLDLRFWCPDPATAEKEGPAEPGVEAIWLGPLKHGDRRCLNSFDLLACESTEQLDVEVTQRQVCVQRKAGGPEELEEVLKCALAKKDLQEVVIGENFAGESSKCVTPPVAVTCAADAGNHREDGFDDTFEIFPQGAKICAKRTDDQTAWGLHLVIRCKERTRDQSCGACQSAQEKISEPEPLRAIDREEVHFQQGGGKPEEKEAEVTKTVKRYCSPRLMAVNLPRPLGPKLFILGEPVLHRGAAEVECYYTVYDWEQKRLAMESMETDELPPDEPTIPKRSRLKNIKFRQPGAPRADEEPQDGGELIPSADFQAMLDQLLQQHLLEVAGRADRPEPRPDSWPRLRLKSSRTSRMSRNSKTSKSSEVNLSSNSANSYNSEASGASNGSSSSGRKRRPRTRKSVIPALLENEKSMAEVNDQFVASLNEEEPEPDLERLMRRGDSETDAEYQQRYRNLSAFEKLQEWLQSTRYEMAVASLLCVNVLWMAFELQTFGTRISYELGVSDTQMPDSEAESWALVFAVGENLFTALFGLDVLVRIFVLRCKFFQAWLNYIDIAVTATSVMELTLTHAMTVPVNPILFRLLRIGKLARAIRMVTMNSVLASLQLLIKCIAASTNMLFWSFCLLTFVQCVAGMIASTLCRDFVEHTANDLDLRLEVFRYYGTFSRTFLTMFEILFANWGPPCRVLVENISEWFSIFFLTYRCVLGFAVLNVVNAVFVQQTMKTASSDEELAFKQKERDVALYTRKVKKLFQTMDSSGDGTINLQEFSKLVNSPMLKFWMGQLELEYHDLLSLFEFLDNGDGEITLMEFIDGAGRLKGGAKALDIWRLETKLEVLFNEVLAKLHGDNDKNVQAVFENSEFRHIKPTAAQRSSSCTPEPGQAAESVIE
ncbi:unnamed protein product [Effrenium voratum]|nr:unnamed protein product [Effrenium voratum]